MKLRSIRQASITDQGRALMVANQLLDLHPSHMSGILTTDSVHHSSALLASDTGGVSRLNTRPSDR